MAVAAPELSRCVAQMPGIVTAKSVQIVCRIGDAGPNRQQMWGIPDGTGEIGLRRSGGAAGRFGMGAAEPDAGGTRLEAARNGPRHRPAQDRSAVSPATAERALSGRQD